MDFIQWSSNADDQPTVSKKPDSNTWPGQRIINRSQLNDRLKESQELIDSGVIDKDMLKDYYFRYQGFVRRLLFTTTYISCVYDQFVSDVCNVHNI